MFQTLSHLLLKLQANFERQRTAFVGKNAGIIEYWSVFFILKLLNALTIFLKYTEV